MDSPSWTAGQSGLSLEEQDFHILFNDSAGQIGDEYWNSYCNFGFDSNDALQTSPSTQSRTHPEENRKNQERESVDWANDDTLIAGDESGDLTDNAITGNKDSTSNKIGLGNSQLDGSDTGHEGKKANQEVHDPVLQETEPTTQAGPGEHDNNALGLDHPPQFVDTHDQCLGADVDYFTDPISLTQTHALRFSPSKSPELQVPETIVESIEPQEIFGLTESIIMDNEVGKIGGATGPQQASIPDTTRPIAVSILTSNLTDSEKVNVLRALFHVKDSTPIDNEVGIHIDQEDDKYDDDDESTKIDDTLFNDNSQSRISTGATSKLKSKSSRPTLQKPNTKKTQPPKPAKRTSNNAEFVGDDSDAESDEVSEYEKVDRKGKGRVGESDNEEEDQDYKPNKNIKGKGRAKDSESEDDDSDLDFYDETPKARARKSVKPSIILKTSSRNNNTSTTAAKPRATERHLIPYPAPAEYLAGDAAKPLGSKHWTLREEDCGIKHMLNVRDEDTVKGEKRFREAARRMNAELGHGVNRSETSFKNFWNRSGRARSGFDERRTKGGPLATSLQGKFAKKGESSATAAARAVVAPAVAAAVAATPSVAGGRKRKARQEEEDDDDDDDNDNDDDDDEEKEESDEEACALALAFGTRQKKKVKYTF